MTTFKQVISLLTLAWFALNVQASDLAKEQRWADQVVDAILDGDAEWLNDGRSDFLTIYTESEDDSKRGLIIMHGTGIHPDWQQVVQPLRVEMTTLGWHTLSIQMPILPNDAEYSEYLPLYKGIAPRVDAARDFLKQNGVDDIVLVGHSQGGAMGAYYLANTESQSDYKGFVTIGTFNSNNKDAQDSTQSMQRIRIPMLDILGSDDLDTVLKYAELRRKTLRGAPSAQMTVDGADHFFEGKETELIDVISDWLDKL